MPCSVIRTNIHDLHRAILVGGLDDVEEILDRNVENVNCTVCGTTALSLALNKDKHSLFKLILTHPLTSHRLDLDKISKNDKQQVEPPLVTACRLGNMDAVKLLIKRGVDLEAKDNFSHTALWVATTQRSTEIVRILIKSGASVDPSDRWPLSPLFFAVRYSSKRTAIAKDLIYNGANVRLPTNQSLLYCAISQGCVNIAKLIIRAGYLACSDQQVHREFAKGVLTRNNNLINLLKAELYNPPSLERQCRSIIRMAVCKACQGQDFVRTLRDLPLPRSIISYVAMQTDEDCSFEIIH